VLHTGFPFRLRPSRVDGAIPMLLTRITVASWSGLPAAVGFPIRPGPPGRRRADATL